MDGSFALCPLVLAFDVLGTRVSQDGNSQMALFHRLSKATRLLHAKSFLWTNRRLSLRTRIIAFYKNVAPCALFGSSGWTLSRSLYDCLRSWELRSLRKLRGGKRRPGETYVDHIRRQNVYLCPRLEKWCITCLGESMLERIFARAKCCLCVEPISDGFNPAGEVLKWKDELS